MHLLICGWNFNVVLDNVPLSRPRRGRGRQVYQWFDPFGLAFGMSQNIYWGATYLAVRDRELIVVVERFGKLTCDLARSSLDVYRDGPSFPTCDRVVPEIFVSSLSSY